MTEDEALSLWLEIVAKWDVNQPEWIDSALNEWMAEAQAHGLTEAEAVSLMLEFAPRLKETIEVTAS